VETDLGDYHLAYQTKENQLIDREKLYSLITKMGKSSKNCEVMLIQEQLKLLTDTFSTAKIRKKRKNKQKNKK
jgi:hypothetical protein